MSQSEQLTVSIPGHLLQFVRAKIASDEFASESDVILHALESLRLDEEEIKRWELEVIVPRYQKFLANPVSSIPLEEVERHLEEHRKNRRP